MKQHELYLQANGEKGWKGKWRTATIELCFEIDKPCEKAAIMVDGKQIGHLSLLPTEPKQPQGFDDKTWADIKAKLKVCTRCPAFLDVNVLHVQCTAKAGKCAGGNAVSLMSCSCPKELW